MPFTGPDTILRWSARLEEAGSAPTARRALLLDALEVETSRFLTETRRRARVLSDLRLLLAEAEAAGMAADLSGDDLGSGTTRSFYFLGFPLPCCDEAKSTQAPSKLNSSSLGCADPSADKVSSLLVCIALGTLTLLLF
jgi:hypothetical protein